MWHESAFQPTDHCILLTLFSPLTQIFPGTSFSLEEVGKIILVTIWHAFTCECIHYSVMYKAKEAML
jgi:hypothetical protein